MMNPEADADKGKVVGGSFTIRTDDDPGGRPAEILAADEGMLMVRYLQRPKYTAWIPITRIIQMREIEEPKPTEASSSGWRSGDEPGGTS